MMGYGDFSKNSGRNYLSGSVNNANFAETFYA